MKFTLEIELGGAVNTPADVAELLSGIHNELRQNGFGSGVHDVSTRSYWRQSADGESSELVAHTVGKWEVTDETACAVCGVPASQHGHYDAHDPKTHQWKSR